MTTDKPSLRDLVVFPKILWSVQVDWDFLESYLERLLAPDYITPLELDPDFQRGHVWSEDQQSAYVEFRLSGGSSGREIFFNCPGWRDDYRGPFQLVDGLQRLTAARRFVAGEIPAFGRKLSEFSDSHAISNISFSFSVAAIENTVGVLDWYLQMNEGGTPHSAEEIARVKSLREQAFL